MKYILAISMLLCTFSSFAQSYIKETVLDFRKYYKSDALRIWKDHPFDSSHIYTFQLIRSNSLHRIADFRRYKKMIRIVKREKPANTYFVFYKGRAERVEPFSWGEKNNYGMLSIKAYEANRFFLDASNKWYYSDRRTLMVKGVIVFGKKGRKNPSEDEGDGYRFPKHWHEFKLPKGYKLSPPPIDSIHFSPPTDVNGNPIKKASVN